VQRWDLELIKAGGCSVEDIMLKAKALKQKQGLDMIVIDYLQLMTAAGYQNNRVAEISFITRRLKLMAESLELPLVVLSQLSRAVEARNDKHPILADLRDSGSIEQDADVVMFIYRDSYYNEGGDDWTEVIVKKNRQGGKGTARFNFLMDRCRFTPYMGIVGEKANRSEKAQVKEVFE
jgi:replicative DNA helicase